MRRSSIALLVLASAVTGCVRPSSPPPVAPEPVPAPPPPPSAPAPALDWRDQPLTPGTWVHRRDERGSLALFGITQASARALLRCDVATRAIYLSRSGAAAGPMTIRTTSTTRTLTARATGGTAPYVGVEFAASDPLLDAMAFSRGRFTIEQPGAATLVLPPYAEIGRVIEDCRG